MIIISHRGFINGINDSEENNPIQIDKCINLNFHVEIDVWYENKLFYLGHDAPSYKISYRWIEDRAKFLWIHCKNLAALDFFVNNKSPLNFFFHDSDDYTLTSQNFIWTYPDRPISKNCVIVAPTTSDILFLANKIIRPHGVCTDYPIKLKEIFN